MTYSRSLLLLAAIAVAVVCLAPAKQADAHQDGCHRWHSCPSDSGSYVCGDSGYTSECGSAPDLGDPSLYDGGSDYGADPAGSASDIPSPTVTRVNVNADARHRAEAKLAAAQSRFAVALGALPAAQAAVSRVKPGVAKTRARGKRLSHQADVARARATYARRAMVAGRTLALRHVRTARTAYSVRHSRWLEARRSSVALAVALLLVAATLALWRSVLQLAGAARARHWDRRGYARAAAVAIASVGVLVAITLSAVDLPAGGATAVLLVALAVLATLAWSSTRPGARFVLRRLVTTSILAALIAVLSLATLTSGLSAAEPHAPTVDRATMALARLGTTPGAEPTADVTRLDIVARHLERKAAAARRGAATARTKLREAQGKADSLQSDVDDARAAVGRLGRRVQSLAPKFETSYTDSGSTDGCDPNYAGACLDPNSPDYDCENGSGDGPDYTGPVEVVGDDPYGLDANGDGFACGW